MIFIFLYKQRYTSLLCDTPLFKGFCQKELECLLSNLSCSIKPYPKGEVLLMAGFGISQIGVLLEGEIEATKNTPGGTELTMLRMKAGGVFGDVLSGSHSKSPVTVTAATACVVLHIPYASLAGTEKGQSLHIRFMTNLISVISDKYFMLDRRIDLLLIKSLRSRICLYLLDACSAAGKASFTIPYTRAALAGYLGCERSALSREISRMAQEKIISVNRREFCIPEINLLKSYI